MTNQDIILIAGAIIILFLGAKVLRQYLQTKYVGSYLD